MSGVKPMANGGSTSHFERLPRYEFPRLPLLRFTVDLLWGRPRSFAQDSDRVMDANPYPRRFEGLENIPADRPFILVMNHYNRPGLRPYHCAMAISAAMAERRRGQPEVRWLFTSELLGRHIGPLPVPLWLIRSLFRRIAHIYDLLILPRREDLLMARAAALRDVTEALTRSPVGLAPEGAGSGRLVEPPRGAGLLLASLARGGAPLLPAAICEEGSTLVIRFGDPFPLAVSDALPRDDRDHLAKERAMVAIGRLLPRSYRGAYEAAVDQSGERRH